MSTKANNTLGMFGLGLAVAGVMLGLLILFASGMSNDQDGAHRMVFLAFPIPAFGFLFSLAALILAQRRGQLRSCAVVSCSGLALSAAMILLTCATLRTYR